jgi:cytochrome c oxidase assembly protein subunit 15
MSEINVAKAENGFGSRFTARLPANVTRTVRRLAVGTLVGQIVLVVTGGAVRLTASGLGCPRWPRCNDTSYVYTPEMGIHGIIEFGNRTLTFVLAFVALALLISLWRFRKQRRDLWWLAWSQIGIIPAQAIIGGITVLTHLNPWVVGLHLLVSILMVVFAVLLVNRARNEPLHIPPVPNFLKTNLLAVGFFGAAAVVLGVIVTGSGPHAGASGAKRNGFNPEIVTELHVVPVYVLITLTVIALIISFYYVKANPFFRRALVVLFAVELVQALIGYVQHFTGLPIALVNLHMLGAALLVAATTHSIDVAYGIPLNRANIGDPARFAASER